MTLGDKLAKLRKENNYTQEQLADILGVSRQAISKWESDSAYPETDKLIRMSDMFNCSLDYLLKDEAETDNRTQSEGITFPFRIRERKSKKTLWGMPLWHIGKNAKGVFAVGLNAQGIVAVGLMAKGFISFGLLSIGLLSVGLLTLGLLSFGLFALGVLCAGCFAAGVFAAGAISFGIISLGAIAIGDFSVGALAIGKYVAIGDNARAMIAIGDTQAIGSIYQRTDVTVTKLTGQEIAYIKNLIDANVPSYLSWAKEIIKLFL